MLSKARRWGWLLMRARCSFPVAKCWDRVLDVVLIGGGAAGMELAMALQFRLAGQGDERARVALVTGGPPPLFGYPQTVIERGLKALAQRRITVFHDSCASIEPGALHLGSGARLACDAPVIATGGDAPPYLAGSGLRHAEAHHLAHVVRLEGGR